ncbi:MAG TPA: hypothetical protein VGK48_05765 [Terriglobia bacterium]|jgi:hypothetical protein
MKTKLSFEAICHQILIEEQTPSKEALNRWQQIYPGYRYAIAEFFDEWATSPGTAPEHEIALGPEAKAAIQKDVAYALDVLRQQGRLVPQDLIVPLRPFDQLVLTAVVELSGRGDGADITEKVSEICGRDVLLASTIASLHRLESQKMLQWRLADPVREPENEGVRYFMTTMAGERSLAQAQATAGAVADFLGEFA